MQKLFFCMALLMCACQPQRPVSESAKNSLHTIRIADGFQIELFASEPLIADPVAMEIDENGNCYVVEMHGYPLDTEGSGKIKLLKDTDHDGFPDQSIVFAENLILPTGVMRWKNGIIVTDAPDVLYLEDTDGDGKADKKEVLLTGFARSNPQHNLNGPVYGLDNWIYLAHEGVVSTKFFEDQFGGTGAEIRFPSAPDAPTLPRNANGRNVRFRPDDYLLEALASDSQFGVTFDPWGHLLLTHNANHLFHEVLPARYLERNASLPVKNVKAYLPDYGRGVEVYPITQNPEHQLLTDVGTITSSCGVTWYLGDLFPAQYQQVTFIAEPVHNLVHADVISDKEATFSASRLLEEKEFLASTDGWFRPVNFYVGPDGALYLIDYYRQIIEHPEWMAEEVVQSGALYNGTAQGRIYRISPQNTEFSPFLHTLKLGEANTATLVKTLEHPNIWWRRHAQRLLVDRKPEDAKPILEELVRDSASPIARVHALWALEGLRHTTSDLLTMTLQDQVAGVRENAIKIAELHLQQFPPLKEQLWAMANDPDPKVRFQLLCTLGYLDDQKSEAIRNQLLFQDMEDEWVPIAALSSPYVDENKLFSMAVQQLTDQETEGRKAFFHQISQMIGENSIPETMQGVLDKVLKNTVTPANVWWHTACLQGLNTGLQQNDSNLTLSPTTKERLLANFSENTPPPLRKASLTLLQTIGMPSSPALQQAVSEARSILGNTEKSPEYRADALYLLSMADDQPDPALLWKIITPSEPLIVQKAALNTLSHTKGTGVCSTLLKKWQHLSPSLREDAIDVFMQSPSSMQMLLTAVENHTIDAATIGWRRSVRLMNHHDEAVRTKARSLLNINNESNPEVLKQYQESLNMDGNPVQGQAIFERVCAQCHQMKGEIGTPFGPDLSAIRNRNPAAIMADVLLPNKSIADGYEFWEVTLSDGNTAYGIITAETATSITLTHAGGDETVIQRAAIQNMNASEVSAMPAGLENQLNPQEMADLIAYLKQTKVYP